MGVVLLLIIPKGIDWVREASISLANAILLHFELGFALFCGHYKNKIEVYPLILPSWFRSMLGDAANIKT
jgi:hypothetical protein